jgi:hypothetical protein
MALFNVFSFLNDHYRLLVQFLGPLLKLLLACWCGQVVGMNGSLSAR